MLYNSRIEWSNKKIDWNLKQYFLYILTNLYQINCFRSVNVMNNATIITISYSDNYNIADINT